MSLKAVLLDFNGTLINDEPIHEALIKDLLIGENLRPEMPDYKEVCLGRSDRVGVRELLVKRGRFISDDYLNRLMSKKAQAYREHIHNLETLPFYPQVQEFLEELQGAGLALGLVTGAGREEVTEILGRGGLDSYFRVIVTGDEIPHSKPEPYGYLLAVERLNRLFPYWQIQPENCLAIEDSLAGIEAAKRAGMQVVGVAHTYPFHIIQRHANWAVDRFADLELDWVQAVFSQKDAPPQTVLE